jgi:AcrR family transcriptional regulator
VPAPKLHDEALRAALLTRAAELLSQQGLEALSLRRVARDAGTSTSAVYSLFGSKAALLDELYREAVTRFASALDTVAETDAPLADLLRLGLAYRDYALANPYLYEIMFDRSWSTDTAVDEEAGRTFEPLLATVRRAQAAGDLGPAPAETIALACWATAHGLVTLELKNVVPEAISVADTYATVLGTALLGWLADPRRLSAATG